MSDDEQIRDVRRQIESWEGFEAQPMLNEGWVLRQRHIPGTPERQNREFAAVSDTPSLLALLAAALTETQQEAPR